MQKITTIIVLVILTTFGVFAAEPIGKIEVASEFESLTKIEDYVTSHPGTTLQTLKESNSELLKDTEVVSDIYASIDSSDLPGNIPPFWWGFCLSLVGFILVIVLADNDKDATKKALVGCLVSGAVGCIVYVGLYVWILGNAAYWSTGF